MKRNTSTIAITMAAILPTLFTPAARAQETPVPVIVPPPATAPPTLPTLPAPSTDAAAAVAAYTITDVEQQALDAARDDLAVASKGYQTLSLSYSGRLPKTPISLKVRDSKVKDALKNALEQAKLDYLLDDDIPDDPKVTLDVENVQLEVVLDLLTENAGVKWRTDTHGGKTVVHVGKKVKSTLSIDALTDPFSSTTKRLMITRDAMKEPYIFRFPGSETRSTFTCSNCHNQITIVRKNAVAKCPTCGRTFESDWKVCPYDGTARPVAQDTWKFCPICAFPIPPTAAADTSAAAKDNSVTPVVK